MLLKLRSMTEKVDGNGDKLEDDVRLTKFGSILRASSLDEFPQLINILKGEMSFVGPRPLLMDYLPLYNREQMQRHCVRPGITGWAQVNGRNTLSWQKKFELDVWYVNHMSFWLDIKILLLTALKVLKREGVSAQNHVTVEPFRGNSDD